MTRQETYRKSKAKARAEARAKGFVRRDVLAHPDDWPQIQKLAKELRDKRT